MGDNVLGLGSRNLVGKLLRGKNDGATVGEKVSPRTVGDLVDGADEGADDVTVGSVVGGHVYPASVGLVDVGM